ncbi:MAG TPA: DUF2203 domain-containing protein, partial [Chloroflexota bacterium]|nr:DUF2203 domain-containing protein [Chloroflexota bacterium]
MDEATQHLPVVGPVLEDAVRLKHEYDELVERLVEPSRGSGSVDPEPDAGEAEAVRLRREIGQRIEFIAGLGIQLKDLDYGLIDFPTMRDGQEVLLCWRIGEPGIAYWHTYDDGFPGR